MRPWPHIIDKMVIYSVLVASSARGEQNHSYLESHLVVTKSVGLPYGNANTTPTNLPPLPIFTSLKPTFKNAMCADSRKTCCTASRYLRTQIGRNVAIRLYIRTPVEAQTQRSTAALAIPDWIVREGSTVNEERRLLR